jgi:hypothetical protein
MFPRAVSAAPTIAFLVLLSGCIESQIRDRHAAAVDSYLPTPFLDPAAPYLDPMRALGPPDGRTVALGIGASVTVRFFREIPDGAGPDIRIYKVGPDGSKARLAVSSDGTSFHEFPSLASGPTSEYDLQTLGQPSALFVRVRGVDNLGAEPGFDLDAVESLH